MSLLRSRSGDVLERRWLVALFLLATAVLAAPVDARAADIGDATYPFARFVGEWTLENDRFEQVWDGETIEVLSIPGHRTNCAAVNTDYSVLCVVDAGGLKGHILWAASADRRSVSHLSHFGDRRVGVGKGSLSDSGDLTLTIVFEDEPEGTYRQYTYEWIDANRYKMMSVQYGPDDAPTGNWYGGVFVRSGLDSLAN
ncbi:MAG: hypothetical protein AAF545_03910 [Pseudomonadota bacterium]